ncbi:MAG: acylphosphatase [Planctomycetaceae bacterium]|nr:acylphosphatase [Planctomycetaceae bacterium]HCK42181.1 acylphosphatase [Planctomycetaceae bacterium]
MFSRAFERRQVYYTGHVQGVGFRYTAKSIAGNYQITGYVRNLSDGRVEVVSEGPVDQLDAFLQELGEQRADHIRSARCDQRPATGEFASFTICY